MTTESQEQKLFQRRARLQEDVVAPRTWLRPEWLLTNLVRVGFLVMVTAVLVGAWSVTSAHLTEQFRGAPQAASGLIDPSAGEGALTPDNIERQVLTYSLRLREDELTQPAGDNPRPRPFVITAGEPARFVAARLQSQGFINDADLFNLYLRVTGLDRRIEAGNFMLAETMTPPEVAEALQSALFEEVVVTIPEGFRAEEIAERLAENNVIEPDRFLAAVRQPQSLAIYDDYDFLQDLPPNAGLEGFLFPDTYRLPVFASEPELVLAAFLDNFEDKVGKNGLVGGGSGLSGRNLITLSSIVEREAVQADERPLIAGVYLNRLNGACAGRSWRQLFAGRPHRAIRPRLRGRLVVETANHRPIRASGQPLQHLSQPWTAPRTHRQPGPGRHRIYAQPGAKRLLLLRCDRRRRPARLRPHTRRT